MADARIGRHRFEALDGWRGLCALVVALWHFRAGAIIDGMGFFKNGFLFVDFFFVLSGFVIAYASEDALDGGGSRWTFLRRRVARIWPLHVVTLAAIVVLEVARFGPRLAAYPASRRIEEIPANFALLHGLGFERSLTWNWPSWSISVEMAMYVAFALLFMTAPKRWRPWVAAGIVAGSLAVLAALSAKYMGATNDYGLERGAAGFFAGYLTQHLWRRSRPQLGTWAELGVVVLVIAFVGYSGLKPISLAAPLVFGLAVWVFASEGGAVSRLLTTRPGLNLGAWSYSIYLIHAPIIVLLNALYRADHLPGGEIQNASHVFHSPVLGDMLEVGFLSLVLLIAPFTYRLIEMPGRRLLSPRTRVMDGLAVPS
jgi:peptidoglycan/LPS O-acetylase OafA/YrhL